VLTAGVVLRVRLRLARRLRPPRGLGLSELLGPLALGGLPGGFGGELSSV